ncbi:MAG: hypothetical protein J0L78_12815 [Planctomycetes bacterium]|nr:hypothetical protein [Planctomycetota bacterium]
MFDAETRRVVRPYNPGVHDLEGRAMQHIKGAVRAATVRLFIVGFLARFVKLVTAAVVALFLATLLDRLLGVAIDWKIWFAAAAGAAFVIALVWSIVQRHRELGAARVLDERAGLRESLSTALCVSNSQDSWAKAVVLNAEEKARGLRVSRAIPIEAPQRWYVPVFAALGVAILWMSLPRYDLLGMFAKREETTAHTNEIVQVKAEVKAKEEKLAEMMAKAGVELKKEGEDDSAPKPTNDINPDEIRRAAVKRLTDVNDRLNQLQNSERQQQLQGLQDQLKQLKQPGPGPLQELTRNLAKGDFAKAQQNLAELQKKLESSALSPQEKEQLKAQLDGLAKQMQEQSAKQEELKNMLQQAGLDKKTAEQLAKQAAQNPEAVKKALEQLKNMPPEQKKKLVESAMSACKSMGQCENMGKSMSQMGQAMSKEGMSEAGRSAMQQLGEQMSEMEQMAQESQALAAAASEAKHQLKEMGGQCENPGECEGCKKGGQCKGGNCKNGMWHLSDGDGKGGRKAGTGKGHGEAPEQASDYRTEKRKSESKSQAGPIIGTRLVYGEQVRGESAAEFASAVETAKGNAAEALETMRVPREYQDAVQSYFGTLEKKAADSKSKAQGSNEKPAESKPAPSSK